MEEPVPQRQAFLIQALRSPVGVGKPEVGWLHPLEPVHLAATLIEALLEQTGIPGEAIEDVILGCVTPIGDQGANIARLAALQAGLPVEVPGVQLNRMCGSGQQAVHFAAQAIIAGRATPPTDAEIEAHNKAGGTWYVRNGDRAGVLSIVDETRWIASEGGYRWWALDAEGRPCAWAVVEAKAWRAGR